MRGLNLDNKILVYTMGKVVSTSIRSSLNKLGRETMNAHTLNPDINNAIEKGFSRESKYVEQPLLDHHKYVYKYIKDNPEIKWKIISLVRDPVARNISTFFQVIDRLLPTYKNEPLITLKKSFMKGIDHEKVLNWQDFELKELTGIDVYSVPFDKKKGYQTYKLGNFEVLLIKYEKLNECVSNAMREFLDIEHFKLDYSNFSENKEYSKDYTFFKEMAKLGNTYLNKSYQSKYIKHFYTDVEIEQFRKRWHYEN